MILSVLSSDIYVEDDWPLRRSYRVEDFLWSGSGDGQQDGGSGNGQDPGGGGSTWRTTTIVRTTTVYPLPPYTTLVQEYPLHTPSPCAGGVCTSEMSPSLSETSRTVPFGSIQPTPTFILPSPTVQPPLILPEPDKNVSIVTPHQQFWLLTVLRVNSSVQEPSIPMMEARLAQLYKIAFNRLALCCLFRVRVQFRKCFKDIFQSNIIHKSLSSGF